MSEKIELSAMPTPNPNTIKFLPNITFFKSGTIDFPEANKGKSSPLVNALFNIDNISGVMIGFNFISVTKNDSATWEQLVEPVRDTIIKELEADNDPIDLTLLEEAEESAEQMSEIAEKIKAVIDNEIRPAVAMDGGDILFKSFENGIVTLQLQGACSNCPSSTMTLKMGIEGRLKEEFPEVEEVVQEGGLV